LTTSAKIDYQEYIYTPADLGDLHVSYDRDIKAHPGVKFGLASIDKCVIPARGGNLIAFVARPGHGKTSMMARWAKVAGQDIIADGMAHKQCAIYITLEQVAEELEAYFSSNKRYNATDYAWGRAKTKDVEEIARARAGLPVWIMGHSLKRSKKRLPPLTPEVMYQAILRVEEDYGFEVVIVFVDYVQIVPMSGQFRSRTERVDEALVGLKNVAIQAGVPIVVGVQSGRGVDERKWKIPIMSDCQHTSMIEQTVDKLYGLWRPWKTEKATWGMKHPLSSGQEIYVPNTPELLIIGMMKQRMDQGTFTWLTRFTPQELLLAELETGITEPPQAKF